ncbi:HNH endonuclease [Flavobacterium sp. MFBS3-15]|uniref:HNH endonuclease signature motif containing protein n=1 Tax=Flavobacterium sp. MFBS3-15 TaxID=2989816 RepID=UPI0022358E21|nr:HNH endonuclease signature motif containing protein [Flavobacterium sp. MFBS3-15]MCW4470216.1 HNH endonuclease [Flavobacterium sp. MFBS3-15]
MLVNQDEAAIYLGITKELLFSFVKKGYNGRKLAVYADINNNFFNINDLINWNTFLHEPISINESGKRPEIPIHIREYLKVESNGKCARCGSGHRLDNAHITPWADSFSHHPHNLIRLCTDCHTKYDDQIITKEEIVKLKERLIEKLKAENSSYSIEISNHRLPKLIQDFKGRESELNELSELYKKNHIISIEGVGGMGKTQLLLKFIERKKLTVYWFNVELFSGFQDFVIELFNRFQVNNFDELLDVINDKNAILVFDGIETLWSDFPDKVTQLLKQLYDYAENAKIIFTTQFSSLAFDINLGVLKISKGLDEKDSFILLSKKNLSIKIDDKYIKKIISFSNGHPLTLIITSGLIYMMKSPQQAWESIDEAGVSFIINPNNTERKKSSSIELCFDLAYKGLDEKQKWLLMYLSLFPAGCKVPFLEILVGKDSPFKTKTDLKMSIAFLSQYNLIDFEIDSLGFERTIILNPIRIFVRKKTGSSSKALLHSIQIEAFENLIFEAVSLYSNYMLSDEIEYAIIRYEIELPNYLFAFKKSVHASYCNDCSKYSDRENYLRIVTGLSAGLYKYLFTRGKFSYGIDINKQGARAHIELNEFDLAVDDLTQVATLNWRIGNEKETESALLEMQKCEELSGKRFSTVRFIEGEILRKSNPRAAIVKFEEGISICESNLKEDGSDETFRGNIGNMLSEIGRTYERYLNDSKTALGYYLKGYHIQREIKDFANMFCNSHHIGNCYADSGFFEKSLEYYQEAIEGFIKYGQQQYIGNSLCEIGKLRVTNPDLDYSFLTKDLLLTGLEDVQYEIAVTEEIGLYLESKLWRIIGVVALSEHSLILNNWATSLLNTLDNKRIFEWSLPYFFAQIAIISNELENDKGNSEKLQELKNLCYLHGGETEHDILDPYCWLSLWLKEKNIENVSRGELYYQIESEFWDNYGDEFSEEEDND